MSGGFDTSELRTFAVEMIAVPVELQRHALPVVKRGAQNIKDDMVAAAANSTHFRKPLAPSISYDIEVTDGGFEAEIGPDKERGGGALANIAYYGDSLGAGSVEDPQKALDREAPKFEAAIDNFLDGIL